MNFAFTHDVNSFIGAAYAFDSATATAGGANDDATLAGTAIDRTANGDPLSVSFVVRYKAVLGAANTISMAATIETAVDSAFTVPVTLATFAAAVVDTGATGGSTQRGVKRFWSDLAGAMQYIRIKLTPDLSATSTDTAEISAVAVFGGQDTLPEF